MMSLRDVIKTIEEDKDLGIFSKDSKTIDHDLSTHEIPLADKPSQQVLTALGSPSAPSTLLTAQGTLKTTGNTDVEVKSFTPKVHSVITLTGPRVDRLLGSVKTYVNTSIFPEKIYPLSMRQRLNVKDDPLWDIQALGLCHAQEVDILVDTSVSEHGRAHVAPLKNGTVIDKNAPALLLLSSPRLNLNKDYSDILKTEAEQFKYLKGMYYTLFEAAISEGREYIVMPEAGLGRHGGNPKMYFAALMEAAKKYKTLNIIYNAGDYDSEFDKAWKKAEKPENIGRTSKNILFVAAKLLKKYSCAMHNPSSSEVMYGLSDVGEHWQSISGTLRDTLLGTDPGKTLQAYLGTITTAVLGSRVNPLAYKNVVEKNLSDVEVSNDASSEYVMIEPQAAEKPATKGTASEPAVPATAPPVIVNESRQSKAPRPVTQPQADAPVLKNPVLSPNSSLSFFPPVSPSTPAPNEPQAKKSLFDEKQLKDINKLIKRLDHEAKSWLPYPNKDLKRLKVKALRELIENGETMDNIPNAIAAVKSKYKTVDKGIVSTRTSDLLKKLEGLHKAPQAFSCCHRP